ncbi:MAG: hypothetical protein QXL10_04530 [Candidatus Bathyarchaeia archaeon]
MSTDKEKMEKYQEIIDQILRAFGKIPFYVIVESTMKVKVEPFDEKNPKDIELVKEISGLADELAETYYHANIDEALYKQIKGHKPTNFRNNEAAVLVEELFVPTYNRISNRLNYIRTVVHFGQRGYPDTRIIGKDGRITYLEIKATTRPNEGSPRDFYFTPLAMAKAKIKSNAHHFVLGFIMKESSPKIFHTIGWKLVDLHKINVHMKPEFNCDNLEIYKKEAIISERLLK